MKKSSLCLALMAVVALTTGCSTLKPMVTAEADVPVSTDLPEITPTADEIERDVTFPNPAKATYSKANYRGSWPNWSQVAQVEHDMTKQQVMDLIGHPHFDEGYFNVKKWNFLFNYRDEAGEHKTCQYQLHFDGKVVTGIHWSDESCKALATKEPAKVIERIIEREIKEPVVHNHYQVQQVATPTLKESLELSTDALFAFNKAGMNDISHNGRMQLERVAQTIKQHEAEGQVVAHVIGHTDLLGSDEYNMTLSKKRADTVVAFLLQRGVKPTSLNAIGAGEYLPRQQCHSNSRQKLISCLAPNRRVEVQIYSYN